MAKKSKSRPKSSAVKHKPSAKPKAPQKTSGAKPAANAKSAPQRLKGPPAGAELIVRQGFLIDATRGLHAVPEVVIMANTDGLRYLADVFTHLADQARARKAASEELVVELPRHDHPVNPRLSDDLEFRFAALTDSNRKALFKRFGIDMKSRQQGSLFERYQEVVTQFSRLTAQMKRTGETPVALAAGPAPM